MCYYWAMNSRSISRPLIVLISVGLFFALAVPALGAWRWHHKWDGYFYRGWAYTGAYSNDYGNNSEGSVDALGAIKIYRGGLGPIPAVLRP